VQALQIKMQTMSKKRGIRMLLDANGALRGERA
jgi:hypothetical protein